MIKSTKFKNDNGSSYNFFVDNFNIMIEAKGKSGKLFMFSVANSTKIENGELETKQGKKLPVYDNADAIQEFIDNAETRTLREFKSHEEMMVNIRNSKKETGKCFESNGKHCFYEYN